MVMALVQTVPIAAFECSSQPPTSECCDDRLNSPCEPRSRMVHAARRWLSASDRGASGPRGQPGVDGAADRVADDAA